MNKSNPQETYLKRLELLQSIVDRQARNSFQSKTFAIILLTALAGLSIGNATNLLVVGAGVVLVFWILDAYYLSRERLFRSMYERVAVEGSSSMSLSPKLQDRVGYTKWGRCMVAHSEWLLYGTMLAGILILSILR